MEAITVCAHCGGGPIEWHAEYHVTKPNARVHSLAAQGASIARIEAELERCVPLCRSCHMKEDGRLAALHRNKPRQKGVVLVGPRPCSECGRPFKPLRRGKCWTCYERAGRT